jgi:hypothetical protein
MSATLPCCPCGHPLDGNGRPDEYVCSIGKIYGPCDEDNCGGGVCRGQCAADGYGNCYAVDGCCDPEDELRSRPRRCESEACDEYDGIHCYGDGCALARKMD